MSIRTRCPLGSTARAVLVVPSFRPPPFFSPRKNHHHLYYPFFPLSSPLVVSHLITPRRKPLRHLSMRPARRRRSSTRVSFPVARTSDFLIVVSRPLLFSPRKKSQQLLFRASQKLLARKQRRRILVRGFSRLVFSPSFILTTRVVVLFLSLSLSLSLFALQREEKKRKILLSSGEIILSFYLKKTLSLFCGCGARSPRARKPHQTKRSQKERKNIFFFCFFSHFFFVAWCKRIELMTFEVRCCFLSRYTRKRYFLTHHKKKHTHHERSTHTDESDDSDEFERGSFSSRSRSRSGTKEAETPTRGNIMPL